MRFKLLKICEVCHALRWCETTLYDKKRAGIFPQPFRTAASKKSRFYFEHEIELYVKRAMHISTDDEFRALAREIELSRNDLVA